MKNIASCIDHTFLKAAGEREAISKLCREARRYRFASVCVNPCEVAEAARRLKGSGVKVCTVVGFPLGQNTTDVKCLEAEIAIEDGAAELDFVINMRLLKYNRKLCAEELNEIVRFCRAINPSVILKLIIECCYLTDKEKVYACKMAKIAGFDFVKTSTGFGTGGATAADVKLMRKTVGRKMGVKAAGGIRTKVDAEKMLAAGANRLGVSASLAVVHGL